ncbi:MAG: hypothetical protein CSA65_08280 [Proteobacteria bacterium]|nr:MAG: hypothetical protein CSA65_08280 [Pseudomonadota bacterium]
MIHSLTRPATRRRRAPLVAARSLLPVALLVVWVGCGAETAEQRTRFALELGASAASRAGVTSDDGYQVTFDRATLLVGTIRFYSGEPLFARSGWLRGVVGASSLAGAFWAVPAARAHPGHYQEGDALAEWLEQRRVNLLAATPTPLGEAAGVTGDYRSMLLTLPKPPAGDSEQTFELELTARKGQRLVRASTSFDLAREVRGIAVDRAIGSSKDGRARVEVDLRALVARIDFEALPRASGATDAHDVIDPESQARNALSRGLISTDAFTARWIPAGSAGR